MTKRNIPIVDEYDANAEQSPNSIAGEIELDDESADVVLRLHCNGLADDGQVHYIAAAPADFRTSFSGSGLPFPSWEHAIEGTPNRGTVQCNPDGSSVLRLRMPNSYYTDFNGTLEPPHVDLKYLSQGEKKTARIYLRRGRILYRTLTYPMERTSPLVYAERYERPAMAQDHLLRENAYPVFRR